MTASPQVNGTARPSAAGLPVFGPWQPTPTTPVQHADEAGAAPAAKRTTPDPIAAAEAEAIRARAAAEAEERRIKAEAEAKAALIRAEEEARKIRLANDRAEQRLAEEQAAREARIAESNRKRREAEQAVAAAAEQAEAERQAREEASAEVEVADDKWRTYALNFYRVCAVVALPVQLNAFYNPEAPWLMAAPLMLEGGAWVVQKGAASAVANGRPSWHYRLIAWLLAFIAAGINLWHGLNAFDPATALGTAFASIAGPGVWDLHEHGRIRKRDGVPTRRERRAARKEEKRCAVEKAAEEQRRREEKEAADQDARVAAQQLARERAKRFPKVWEHALKLAAALGETTVTQSVWRRAHIDIEGTEPGESVDSIRTRNMAARRVAAARSEAPGGTPSKVTNAQRSAQVMARSTKPRTKPVPPRRRPNDTPKFHPVARSLAADAKRQSITARAVIRDTPATGAKDAS